MENPYHTIRADVLDVIPESPLIKTLHLKPEEGITFKTGQFVELTVPNIGEGPFTPSSSHYEQEEMDITIMKAGFVTSYVHQLKKGDFVGLRGPYGKGYPLEKFKGKDILIVGGGVGMAPLRSLLLTLLHDIDDYKSITLCFGAKTPQDVIYKEQFAKWDKYNKLTIHRSVDKVPEGEKWNERVGVVTVLLDDIKVEPKDTIAVVCGPPIMMKFSTLGLIDRGFKDENIYLSMEKKMYCGFGQCRHCIMGKFYACKDGPVFTYAQIKNEEKIWD